MQYSDLANRFAHHPPATDAVAQAHTDVRLGLLTLADELNHFLPEGREKSLVITKLEEAMFWANAAIARNQSEVA